MVATRSGIKPKKRKRTVKPVKAKKPIKTGRPEIKIDAGQVKTMAAMGCTYPEIAAVMECSKATLMRRFATIVKEGKEHLKASLRRWQYASAKDGNVTMQIWLGKQLLGQKDRQEVSGEVKGFNIYLPQKDKG